jgi:hypothetical protein
MFPTTDWILASRNIFYIFVPCRVISVGVELELLEVPVLKFE